MIREREWFPGQTTHPLADGRLELAWPNVPREPFVHWTLSYAGHLEVVAPADLRAERLACGTRIAAVHQRKRPSGS